METWQTVLLTLYCGIVALLSLYGFHRYHMMRLYFKHSGPSDPPEDRFDSLPGVTVQLPMYNEGNVACRIIDAACRLDYPPDKLQIQVLDDSTDETRQLARRRVAYWRARGMDIQHRPTATTSVRARLPLITINEDLEVEHVAIGDGGGAMDPHVASDPLRVNIPLPTAPATRRAA
mgnify:CR=1 FL=1